MSTTVHRTLWLLCALVASPAGFAADSKQAPVDAAAAPAQTATCRTLADRYRPLADANPGISPLHVLAMTRDSGVNVFNPPDAAHNPGFLEDADAGLAAWGNKQQPRIAIPDGLTRHALYGQAAQIEQLPGTSYYWVGTQTGTAHCYQSFYFEVRDGKAVKAEAPPGIENGSCMSEQTVGSVDKAPVFIEEIYDGTPSMQSTLQVATWEHGKFADVCNLRFAYAPAYSGQTMNDWSASDRASKPCAGGQCKALEKAAFTLAAEVQNDPGEARRQGWSRLSKVEQASYRAAGKFIPPASGSADARSSADNQDPDSLLDAHPYDVPYTDHGHLYVASLGHYTVGWRVFADWGVAFAELVNGELVPQGTFPVAMQKGKLTDVSVGVGAVKQAGP